jgi:hypothetical protein
VLGGTGGRPVIRLDDGDLTVHGYSHSHSPSSKTRGIRSNEKDVRLPRGKWFSTGPLPMAVRLLVPGAGVVGDATQSRPERPRAYPATTTITTASIENNTPSNRKLRFRVSGGRMRDAEFTSSRD